tara:strand:- start:208 stop:324 length:117 start_codon:yes stop_codon:yes gene_type:complete
LELELGGQVFENKDKIEDVEAQLAVLLGEIPLSISNVS